MTLVEEEEEVELASSSPVDSGLRAVVVSGDWRRR
jgi:hypothetical protein